MRRVINEERAGRDGPTGFGGTAHKPSSNRRGKGRAFPSDMSHRVGTSNAAQQHTPVSADMLMRGRPPSADRSSQVRWPPSGGQIVTLADACATARGTL